MLARQMADRPGLFMLKESSESTKKGRDRM